jgi:hypothetical protein
MISTLVQDATRYRIPLLIVGALAAAVALLVFVRRLVWRMPASTPWWYYLGALGGLAVSLDTSWRFFGERLGIHGLEQGVMFSVVELALIACALGMRVNVRRVDPATGRPGPAGAPRLVAWALCGLSGYAALLLSGPVEGIARVALGPILGLVMLHLALGIEIRNRITVRTGAWVRVGAELRERALSRLGLADDDRDAATRIRHRAVRRAARLALATGSPWRTARLARALRTAQVAHDPLARERLLAELAVLRCADELATLPLPSPWLAVSTPVSTVSAHGDQGEQGEHYGDRAELPGEQPGERGEQAQRSGGQTLAAVVSTSSTTREQAALGPRAGEDTYASGVLDSVVLAAHAEDNCAPWAAENSKNAAIDRADALLPGRSPRALAAALCQVGVSVAESSVRRRRAQRTQHAKRRREQEREPAERR